MHIETYGGSGAPPRIVKPGDNIKDAIHLSDLYSLDKVGTYTVQLKCMGGKSEIVSNVVSVTVTK